MITVLVLDTSAEMDTRIANEHHLFQKRERDERQIKSNTKNENDSKIKLSQKKKKFIRSLMGERFRLPK